MRKQIGGFKQDFPASIVVLLVALPLCLGVALGSKAALFSGIIAGIVGGIVVGILSGSPLSVSGPAAGLTVIVATAIGKLPSFESFLLAVFLAGIFQLIFGYLKAGVLGDFVPNSVIKGMLAAIGITLILKQFQHLVGYDKDYLGDESFSQTNDENTFSGLYHAFASTNPAALIIGAIALAILIFWESRTVKKSTILKMIPGPLVVVLVSVAMNAYYKAQNPGFALQQEHLVSLPIAGSLGEFLGFLSFPDFSALNNFQVWVTAFTLAVVASLETLLSIEAIDKLDPYKRVSPTNRELKAQGIGNMVSGALGGLPVTSVIVRSSANVNSGGRSKLSTIMHGILMLVCVLFIPGILNLIPLSALAAILVFTGYKLAKIPMLKEFYNKGWDQFVPFIVTILAILLSDLLMGIVIGIIVGLFYMIRSNFRSSVFVVNDKNNYLFRLRKDVSFLNKPIVKRKLESIPEDAYVIIDATRADFIDKDVIDVINEFLAHAHLKNIRVEVKKSQYKPMHMLFRAPGVKTTEDSLTDLIKH